jgi:hypothetical protein
MIFEIRDFEEKIKVKFGNEGEASDLLRKHRVTVYSQTEIERERERERKRERESMCMHSKKLAICKERREASGSSGFDLGLPVCRHNRK